jgi:hypothetical protein
MQLFNGVFNINLEMTHPECTSSLTPYEKMQLTLISPAILGLPLQPHCTALCASAPVVHTR